MPDSYDHESSLLGRILGRIPGFGGYAEQEARQASDQQTRQFIADRLHQTKSHLTECAQSLVADAKIDAAAKCEELRSDVDTVARQVQSQLSGESRFFGTPRIDPDRLEDIYDQDVSLMDQAEELAETARAMKSTDGGSAQSLDRIAEKVTSLKERIADRERMLNQL